MTRYSAPFKVKKPFAETTVLAIDASGNMAVTGNVSANGAANIIGPISSGSAAVKGYAMMVQTTTVVGGTKVNVATLPEGADLIDVTPSCPSPTSRRWACIPTGSLSRRVRIGTACLAQAALSTLM
jgi:hypothetical protein